MAAADNTLSDGSDCFNITAMSDMYKESAELLVLVLNSSDAGVYLCGDVAQARIEANGGASACNTHNQLCCVENRQCRSIVANRFNKRLRYFNHCYSFGSMKIP